MKKSTSARIEDTLDVVADKIIDLENTAKQIEKIKQHITKELDRVENTIIRVDSTDLRAAIVNFTHSLETINEEQLKKQKKINRIFMYIILAQVVLILYVGYLITGKYGELVDFLITIKG